MFNPNPPSRLPANPEFSIGFGLGLLVCTFLPTIETSLELIPTRPLLL
jgi:hypothetical protein